MRKHWGDSAAFFSADSAVHELLTKGAIKTRITAVFGEGVLDADGEIDRGKLRRIAFCNGPLRRKLEGILHPEVQSMGLEARCVAIENQKERLVYEIPLLYEIDSQMERNFDVVVAASEKTQRMRMAEIRGLEPETIEQLITAQIPITQKMIRADFVIWNDAGEAELEEQIFLLLDFLNSTSFEDEKHLPPHT